MPTKKDYFRTMNEKYAVAAIIESPEGIPLVRDPKKPVPRYWKLPGGRSVSDEAAEDTILREIQEEIGLSLEKESLIRLYEEERGSHVFILFGASVSSLGGLRKMGEEGEEVQVFKLDKIAVMPDFFPNHKKILVKLDVL